MSRLPMSDELRKALNQYRDKMGDVSDERKTPDVMPDIKPYRSMLTGELITSRSRHREHLKEHGYEEVGNDSSLSRPYQGIPDAAPQQRKELIRSLIDSVPESQLRKMIKRDADWIKWNSRER